MVIKVIMLGAGLSVQGGITSVEKLILNNAPSDVEIRHIETFIRGGAAKNIATLLNALWILTYSLAFRKADLVHIHFSERGSTIRKLILIPVVFLFRKPLILHSHGAAYKEFFENLPKPLQYILRACFCRCNKFIALSDSWKEYYSDIFSLEANQVVRLYNPVVVPSEVPNRGSEEPIKFVFLGRIGKRGGALDIANNNLPKQDKGAFDLISAFASLLEKDRKRAQLVLAGNGDIGTAKKMILDYNLQDQVTVYSWLYPDERDKLLGESDIFVLPSYNEGLPMSMLEAMAWGLCIIVTPVGGIPEVIFHENNGLLVTPGDQKELSSALSRMINDSKLRKNISQSARQSSQEFDILCYVDSLRDVYYSTLGLSQEK